MDIGPAVEDLTGLAVTNESAGKAVVLILTFLRFDNDRAGRPAVIHGGLIAVAADDARKHGLFTGHVKAGIFQAEVLHAGVVRQAGKEAIVHPLRRIEDRRGLPCRSSCR